MLKFLKKDVIFVRPIIILPDNLYVMRRIPDPAEYIQVSNVFSLYYQNFIYPYDNNFDVKINCKYGKNLERCWRFEPDLDCEKEFLMTVSIYLYGEKLAEKTVNVHVNDRNEKTLSLLCIGDSMTQAEIYITQAVKKAMGIETIGTQCRQGLVRHEGRGGWTLERYLTQDHSSGGHYSPFLFPKSVKGKDYYGDLWYSDLVKRCPDSYGTAGSCCEPVKKGEYVLKDEAIYLFNGECYELFDPNPEFEFNFGKYLERNGFKAPDAVSLLFGANDLQVIDYENTKNEIQKLLERLDVIVSEIKKYGSKIVINLPVLGADQYSWGLRMGCRGTVKQYEYNIKMWSDALLKSYDNREKDGIYICPMMATLDNITGFDEGHSSASPYSNAQEYHKLNWVHPSDVGYKLMGNTLAGVLCEIKNASL